MMRHKQPNESSSLSDEMKNRVIVKERLTPLKDGRCRVEWFYEDGNKFHSYELDIIPVAFIDTFKEVDGYQIENIRTIK